MAKKPAKKQNRAVFYFAMLKSKFEELKTFLDDDKPVYLTFQNTTNYKGDNKETRIMIKSLFEKVEV